VTYVDTGDPESILPTVTVCIVVLNREWVIGEALRSLLSQTYPKELLYVIVVDGGSTDKTVEICRHALSGAGIAGYEIVIQPSTIPEARNICIERARSEYIFFWDSDIIMHPQALEKLVVAARATGADVLSAKIHFLMIREFEEGWHALESLQNNAAGGPEPASAVTMSATLIRRQVFEKVKFDPDLTLYEDLDFCLRARSMGFKVMEHGGIVAVDLNPAWEPANDIFVVKPLRELLRGFSKKARVKALTLSPGPGPYLRYILRYKRYAYYLGYTAVIPLLILGLFSRNFLISVVAGAYILIYLALQVLRRGLRHGLRVFAVSILVGLPLALLMLYYSLRAGRILKALEKPQQQCGS